MHISLIAAMGTNGAIGKNNALLWHLPEELKYFRDKTLGKPVIMGRKTFESMHNKPLPKRHNIILTRDAYFAAPQCTIVHSVHQALEAAGPCEEVMIIGGADVYKAFLPIATRLYLTIVHKEYLGDVYFPTMDWSAWKLIAEQTFTGFTTQIFTKGT